MLGFTNGCFDLLHDGHRHFLTECRKRCDYLIVGLNSDASVRRLKGEGRPVETWIQRTANVYPLADEVRMFDTEADLLKLIARIRPDVIFKGEEYAGKEVVGSTLARVVTIPMLPNYSTTLEIAKCSAG